MNRVSSKQREMFELKSAKMSTIRKVQQFLFTVSIYTSFRIKSLLHSLTDPFQ